ncbi:hypothetical protein D3C76_1325120 [compost metagenome]
MRIAAVTRRPARHVVQIGQDLCIRHFADQIAEKGRNIAVVVRVALTEIELRCDGQITFQRQSATDIANMFMNAKNFLNHNHDRQWTVCLFRARVVGGHVLTLRRDRGFASRYGFF